MKTAISTLLFLALCSIAQAGNFGGSASFVPPNTFQVPIAYVVLSTPITVTRLSGVVLQSGSGAANGIFMSVKDARKPSEFAVGEVRQTVRCNMPIACDATRGTLFQCTPSPAALTFPANRPLALELVVLIGSSCATTPILNIQASYE